MPDEVLVFRSSFHRPKLYHAQVDDHISASVLLSALGVFGSSTTAAGAFGDLDSGIDLLVRLVKE